MLIIAELEKLMLERRIVSEDADRIIVDLKTMGGRLDYDRSVGGVGNQPVELGRRKLRAESYVGEVDAGK